MKFAALLIATLLAASATQAQPSLPDVTALLLKQDYVTLEQTFTDTQQRFERGELTEVQLRQAFEPFEELRDEQALKRLQDWAAQSPSSYVAHLALGLSYRAQGSDARGSKSWDKTEPEQRDGLVRNFTLAEPELRKSIPLTAKPFLSLLNLMTVAGNVQNRPFLNASLLLANEALPGNQLARLSYARYLLPRWGGTYEKYDAFVSLSRTEGVGEATLLKMQAIVTNDRAQVMAADHHRTRSLPLFRQALELARQAGDDGSFRKAYLASALRHICEGGADEPACQPAVASAAPSPAPAAPGTSGTPGADIEHAIVIPTADGTEGVRTEYAWLALRHPGAKRTAQAMIPKGERRYDMLAVTTAEGREMKVYFDISAFFGKDLDAAGIKGAELKVPGKS